MKTSRSNKLFDVSNYTAVVTGGGTGIGLLITQALIANGAKVYITGRRQDALQTVVEKYSTAEAKIRVNSIAPGIFPSEMTAGDSNEHQKSELDLEASNPAGRFGHDTDMGACILFLARPGGVFLNSQILYPDGGKF
jgi:NAD(P)-dependent dehydrogenase (short-subunit alcohol dehydrogenase family)